MANTRLSMRKIKEILRLCWGSGLSARQAAQSCGVAWGTIKNCVDRAERAGLAWPLSEELDETSLENLLFPFTVRPWYLPV
jgi:transposase